MSDLDQCALRLITFIADSVQEAIDNPAAQLEPLSEADCAIRILKKMLKIEREDVFASLMLLPTFDTSLVDIAKGRSDELSRSCPAFLA